MVETETCMLCETGNIKDIETHKDWIKQLKLDGERCLYLKGRLINRRQNDITKKYNKIKIENNCVLDGEIVYFSNLKTFKTDFDKVRTKSYFGDCVYVIFDVIKYEDEDLRNKPLFERMKFLEKIKGKNILTINKIPNIEWNDVIRENHEGLILKNPNSKYEFQRSENWIKIRYYKEMTNLEVRGFTSVSRKVSALITKYGKVNFSLPKEDYEKYSNLIHNLIIKNNGFDFDIKENKIFIDVDYLELTKNNEMRFPKLKKIYEK